MVFTARFDLAFVCNKSRRALCSLPKAMKKVSGYLNAITMFAHGDNDINELAKVQGSWDHHHNLWRLNHINWGCWQLGPSPSVALSSLSAAGA